MDAWIVPASSIVMVVHSLLGGLFDLDLRYVSQLSVK